jgi:hypothetical protein
VPSELTYFEDVSEAEGSRIEDEQEVNAEEG